MIYLKMFDFLLKKNIKRGALFVNFAGKQYSYGSPDQTPVGIVNIKNSNFFSRVIHSGEIGLGESYVSEEWESPYLPDVALVVLLNSPYLQPPFRTLISNPSIVLRMLWQRLLFDHNLPSLSIEDSKKGMSVSYDVSNTFFRYMLGDNMQYTCAIFRNRNDTLEQAQQHKLDVILKKMDLSEHHKVLDIGCGWGTLLNKMYQKTKCSIKGIALAKEQINYCKENYNFGKFEYKDYRELNEESTYDRIVSIGMMEHVGFKNFPVFIDKIVGLLKPGGRALLHLMISGPLSNKKKSKMPRTFPTKYVMPVGYIPMDFEITDLIIRHPSLRIMHQEKFGVHYGETMRRWRENILNNVNEIKKINPKLPLIYDYTWAITSAAFTSGYLDLWQIVIEKNPISNDGALYDPRA
jgi:cyclopropane-fatty-acyl-phospholipid synthase